MFDFSVTLFFLLFFSQFLFYLKKYVSSIAIGKY